MRVWRDSDVKSFERQNSVSLTRLLWHVVHLVEETLSQVIIYIVWNNFKNGIRFDVEAYISKINCIGEMEQIG